MWFPVATAPLTVVILTYQRPTQVAAAVLHYCASPLVQRVFVVTNDRDVGAPAVRQALAAGKVTPDRCRVVLWETPHNSLNNRFAVWRDIHTEAVLSGTRLCNETLAAAVR